MQTIKLHHLTLTEDVRDHILTGTYYRVAHRGRILPFTGNVGEAPEGESVSVEEHIHEIIEINNDETGLREYFGFDVKQYRILYAMLGHAEKTIDQKVERALVNERRFSQWNCNRIVGEQRDKIRALPWWKRLFNKF